MVQVCEKNLWNSVRFHDGNLWYIQVPQYLVVRDWAISSENNNAEISVLNPFFSFVHHRSWWSPDPFPVEQCGNERRRWGQWAPARGCDRPCSPALLSRRCAFPSSVYTEGLCRGHREGGRGWREWPSESRLTSSWEGTEHLWMRMDGMIIRDPRRQPSISNQPLEGRRQTTLKTQKRLRKPASNINSSSGPILGLSYHDGPVSCCRMKLAGAARWREVMDFL